MIEDSPPDNCTVFVPGSHRLTVQEKEGRYGITALVKPGGNLRYARRDRGRIPRAAAAPGRRGGPLPPPSLLHASAGFVNGAAETSSERMSLTFRVASAGAALRDEAFPGEREHRGGSAAENLPLVAGLQ